MPSSSDNCVSIRARVRKSQRAIDPEFDVCQETIVSFVDHSSSSPAPNNSSSNTTTATNNNNNNKGDNNSNSNNNNCGPALQLTPIPTAYPVNGRTISTRSQRSASAASITSVRSVNNNNATPSKRRQRSFNNSGGVGPGPPLTNLSMMARKHSTKSDVSCLDNNDIMMSDDVHLDCEEGMFVGGGNNNNSTIDVSTTLDDEKLSEMGGMDDSMVVVGTSHQQQQQQQHRLQLHLNRNNKPGLPPQPPIPAGQQSRYSSPLAVIRTSSGVSNKDGGSSVRSSSDHNNNSSSSNRSLSSRSRSRSRRRGGGHSRMRSAGAASAFASAASNGSAAAAAIDDGDFDCSVASYGQQQQQQPPIINVEPITIPLKDVLSVDEEIPSRRGSRVSSHHSSGGSDFYSSAASDVSLAKEQKKKNGKGDSSSSSSDMVTPKTTNVPHPLHLQLRSPSPPPPNAMLNNLNNSQRRAHRIPHRIFLHTLSHGYIEFTLENENSHDIFMAYLKAHLPSDRIPIRGSSGNNGNGGGLRTMILTPSKDGGPRSSSNGSVHSHHSTTQNGGGGGGDTFDPNHTGSPRTSRSLKRPTLVSRDSSSVSVCSNKIDKLHSKVINQRIKHEFPDTPFQRMKESVAGWMSNIIDCACCQDTTTVAPVDVHVLSTPGRSLKTGGGGGGSSPNSETLRKRGIGGLSFEVEQSSPSYSQQQQQVTPSSPKLSFE